MEISKQSAMEICDALDLNAGFFDEDSEEWQLMKSNNPWLLEAYEEIFTCANADE